MLQCCCNLVRVSFCTYAICKTSPRHEIANSKVSLPDIAKWASVKVFANVYPYQILELQIPISSTQEDCLAQDLRQEQISYSLAQDFTYISSGSRGR